MSPDRLFERIGESIAHRTQGSEVCEALALNEIRLDIHKVLQDAFNEAPCSHPPNQVHNNRCFLCGRVPDPF